MTAQLELDLDARRRRLPRPWTLGRLALVWAPVWLPAALVTQLALGGLLPALAESRRLDAATQEVERRERELSAEHAGLVRERRKLTDEIYRERLRKSRARAEALLPDAE